MRGSRCVIFSEWGKKYLEDVVEFEDEFGDFVFVGFDLGEEGVEGHLIWWEDLKIIER
jgi:hypothetical protein